MGKCPHFSELISTAAYWHDSTTYAAAMRIKASRGAVRSPQCLQEKAGNMSVTGNVNIMTEKQCGMMVTCTVLCPDAPSLIPPTCQLGDSG